VSFLIYDESWLNINDLSLMREIMIIVHVHALYQTLLSCIQSIFVFLIFKYIKKFLKFKSNDDSNRICKEVNDEKRLIVQDLCNDLSYHHKRLRIQFYIIENLKMMNKNKMMISCCWTWFWSSCVMQKILTEFSIIL